MCHESRANGWGPFLEEIHVINDCDQVTQDCKGGEIRKLL